MRPVPFEQPLPARELGGFALFVLALELALVGVEPAVFFGVERHRCARSYIERSRKASSSDSRKRSAFEARRMAGSSPERTRRSTVSGDTASRSAK